MPDTPKVIVEEGTVDLTPKTIEALTDASSDPRRGGRAADAVAAKAALPLAQEKQTAEIAAKAIIVQGQQGTSNKWETTQSAVALMWSTGTLVVLVAQGLALVPVRQFAELLVITTVIVQSYFQRTNSHRVGGVSEGKSADER